MTDAYSMTEKNIKKIEKEMKAVSARWIKDGRCPRCGFTAAALKPSKLQKDGGI